MSLWVLLYPETVNNPELSNEYSCLMNIHEITAVVQRTVHLCILQLHNL